MSLPRDGTYRMVSGELGSAPLSSRLLDLPAAAQYLGLSAWTIRDLLGNGTLRRVRVPLPNGGELRRVLLDRQDLDALIERWKA